MKYKPEMNAQAQKLAELGAIDKDIHKFFGICEKTLNIWKIKFPDFHKAIIAGKLVFDNKIIEGALFDRAKGYTHDDMHIAVWQGEVIQTPIKKHYPPDTKAIELWLHNRSPDKWKKNQTLEHTGGVTIKVIRDD